MILHKEIIWDTKVEMLFITTKQKVIRRYTPLPYDVRSTLDSFGTPKQKQEVAGTPFENF